MEDLHIKAEEQVEKMTDREVASLLGISLKSYIINKKENWDKAIDKKVQDLYDDIVGEQEARAEAMKEEGYAKGGLMTKGMGGYTHSKISDEISDIRPLIDEILKVKKDKVEIYDVELKYTKKEITVDFWDTIRYTIHFAISIDKASFKDEKNYKLVFSGVSVKRKGFLGTRNVFHHYGKETIKAFQPLFDKFYQEFKSEVGAELAKRLQEQIAEEKREKEEKKYKIKYEKERVKRVTKALKEFKTTLMSDDDAVSLAQEVGEKDSKRTQEDSDDKMDVAIGFYSKKRDKYYSITFSYEINITRHGYSTPGSWHEPPESEGPEYDVNLKDVIINETTEDGGDMVQVYPNPFELKSSASYNVKSAFENIASSYIDYELFEEKANEMDEESDDGGYAKGGKMATNVLEEKIKKLANENYQGGNDYPKSGKPVFIKEYGTSLAFHFKNTDEETSKKWVSRYVRGQGLSPKSIEASQDGDYHDDWVQVDVEFGKGGSMAKGGKFESAEDAYNQASYYLSDNKVPSKEVALKKHGNKLDKLLGNYSNSLYPILDAYYNNDDKQTMREWFDEIESSHYAKGGKIDALDRYLMIDSIVHWFKFKKEEVEKWSDDKLIQWSNKANKGVAKGMRFGNSGSMATGGSVMVRMKVSDMDDFTDYLQDSNIQRNQITFEEDDFIVVSKDLADELENDKVAYTIMGNIHGYSKGGEMSDKTIIYYVKGDEVVTNISLTEVEALQAQEKHNKTFVSKYGFGHIYKTEVATSDWNDGKIMASNWKEWERKKNTSGVAMETGGNLQDKYEQTRNQNLIYHGFDVLKLSQNQKNLILEPNEAPENYMMDGEINAKQAFGMWKNRLVKSGLSASDVKRAIELNFKYSGGKLHNLIKSEEHKNQ